MPQAQRALRDAALAADLEPALEQRLRVLGARREVLVARVAMGYSAEETARETAETLAGKLMELSFVPPSGPLRLRVRGRPRS